jgi:hypothetical protein
VSYQHCVSADSGYHLQKQEKQKQALAEYLAGEYLAGMHVCRRCPLHPCSALQSPSQWPVSNHWLVACRKARAAPCLQADSVSNAVPRYAAALMWCVHVWVSYVRLCAAQIIMGTSLHSDTWCVCVCVCAGMVPKYQGCSLSTDLDPGMLLELMA